MTPQRTALATAIATCIAGTAAAQETASCGQPALLTQTLSEPLIAAFDERVARVALPRGETAYVEFTVIDGQTVHLYAEDEQVDPLLTLYDSFGNVVGYDDDSAGDLNALLEVDLTPGTYCAQLRLLDVETDPSARVTLWLSSDGAGFPEPQEEDEDRPILACEPPAYQGDLATGLSTGFGPTLRGGTVLRDTGEAGYSLDLTEPLTLQLDTRSDDFDTVLMITDSANELLYENDDFDGSNSRLTVALDPGAYCVAVRSYDGTAGAFELMLSPPSEDATLSGTGVPSETNLAASGPFCTDPAQTLDLTQSLAPGFAPFTTDGSNDNAVGHSAYTLSVTDPLDLRLQVNSSAFDTLLAVFDAGGALVADNDDHPDMSGNNSRIDTTLAAGDYCIVVAGFDGTSGPFGLTLTTQDGARPMLPTPDLPQADQIEELGDLEDRVESKRLSRDRILWTAFTAPSSGPVRIEAGNLSGAFELVLMTETGVVMERLPSEGQFARATLERDLPGGRYFVAIVNAEVSDALQVRQIIVTRP